MLAFPRNIFQLIDIFHREHATKEELDIFALTLLSNMTAATRVKDDGPSEGNSLQRRQAIERILASAEFWELPRIRRKSTTFIA